MSTETEQSHHLLTGGESGNSDKSLPQRGPKEERLHRLCREKSVPIKEAGIGDVDDRVGQQL